MIVETPLHPKALHLPHFVGEVISHSGIHAEKLEVRLFCYDCRLILPR